MKAIIKQGNIVSTEGVYTADILMENGKIKLISNEIIDNDCEKVIDANGKYVFPGGVDVHTHLSNDGMSDDFESGSIAAAAGGTTSVINMNDKLEEDELLSHHINKWKDIAKSSVVDYAFHEVIPGHLLTDNLIEDLPKLVEHKSTSIKLFMAYDDKIMSDANLYKIIKKASELGLTILVHAEEGQLIKEMINDYLKEDKFSPINHAYTRPSFTEASAVKKVIEIGKYFDAKMYIVHVTCHEALNEIIKAKSEGVNVIAETCPQYLILNQEYLKLENKESAKYVCTPPLRENLDQQVLWNGIKEGFISTVGSDHCSLDLHGPKNLGESNFSEIANGIAGIEDRFLLLYHYGVNKQKISLQDFVNVVSTKPAEVFGLTDKGSISIGKDADIVILDPNKQKTISKNTQHMAVDHNPYEGFEIQGDITHVFLRGALIIEDNKFIGDVGSGRFINRNNTERKL